MKRISLILITIIITSLLFNITAAADTESPRLVLSQKALGDNKIQVDVLAKNFSSVYGAQLVMDFDKTKLTALEINGGDVITGDNAVEISKKTDNTKGKIVYAVTNTGEGSKAADNGVLVTIIFETKGQINLGTDITISTKTVFADNQGEIISVNLQGKFGTMTIQRADDADSFKNGGEAKVEIKVSNDTDKIQEVTFIMALYDRATNKLVDLTYLKADEIESDQTVELSAALKIPESGNYKVKCFVWNDIDKMEALSDVIEINVTK